MLKLFKKKIKPEPNKSEEIIPKFIGTKNDFNKYLNGYIKILLRKLTKSYKKSISKCENCDKSKLSKVKFHLKGKERKEIINKILSNYESNGLIKINLDDFEKYFIDAYSTTNITIKTFCKSCHNVYKANKTLPMSDFKTDNYYKSARLTFSKKFIEPLKDDDIFTLFVSNTNESFRMTKGQFYETFSNVVASNSYRLNGIYSYTVIPRKTYQYLS